jgi:hypothetical protein
MAESPAPDTRGPQIPVFFNGAILTLQNSSRGFCISVISLWASGLLVGTLQNLEYDAVQRRITET